MTNQSRVDTLHIECDSFNQCVVDLTIPFNNKKLKDVNM